MRNINKQELREKFEAWAERAGALPWGYLKKQRTDSGNYSDQIYTYMWLAWNSSYFELLDERDTQNKLAELEASRAALVAENEALKSNLIYWGGEDSEPVRSPLDYAHEAGLKSGEEFEMQVAARMPNLTYRVVSSSRFKTEIELIGGLLPETPATDAFLAEVRAQGVDMFSEKFGGGTPLSNMVKEVAADFAAKLRKGGE